MPSSHRANSIEILQSSFDFHFKFQQHQSALHSPSSHLNQFAASRKSFNPASRAGKMMSRNVLRQSGRIAGALSASGRIAAVSSNFVQFGFRSFQNPFAGIKELPKLLLKLEGSSRSCSTIFSMIYRLIKLRPVPDRHPCAFQCGLETSPIVRCRCQSLPYGSVVHPRTKNPWCARRSWPC